MNLYARSCGTSIECKDDVGEILFRASTKNKHCFCCTIVHGTYRMQVQDDLQRLREELIASASKDAAAGWDAYSLRALDAAIARTEQGIRVSPFSDNKR